MFTLQFLKICVATLSVAYSMNIPYQELYFNQTLDHFSFVNADITFKQRYLINDKWWDKGRGPIFFYTGNEGDITSFWKNTGFMFNIAPQFKALIVFAEHRYYGKTFPLGPEKSFTKEGIRYLTVEQALADFTTLIGHLKQTWNATECPVVAFGGSYGGMLSAYMRFKYPNMVIGSIAASAPIYLVGGSSRRDFFFQDVTNDFKNAGCESQVREAFKLMNQKSSTKAGLSEMSKKFNLCTPLKSPSDYRHLLLWLRNVFTVLAMMDYPYPTQFLSKLPGNPVKKACELMLKDNADIIESVVQVSDMVYGKIKCHAIYTEYIECADPTGCGLGSDSSAWDYQACGELLMPAGSNNVTDMFPVLPYTEQQRTAYCKDKWGITPRSSWFAVSMWGKQIKSASNIVFSNGDLDPWRRGGVINDVSSTLKAAIVKGGAHHLDLRGSNKLDPQSVKDVRKLEVEHIKKWLSGA